MLVKKRVAPMWLIHDTLFHYSDYERAKRLEDGKDTVKQVWVGVDVDYFIGTWQKADDFKGWIFDSEEEAIKEVEEWNR